ncbi:hypothetical protein [Chenggangzhangella methanolivorans]|uniref:Helix-turn-helix domain-containing protein n=1 Tax=Chenggangzhangella methanolivorans TaxID=1437009 RepID=A0A9E6ULP6_9HYPH|nr:hypothetical protein [Chenggangzhangella methanolivorans]QZO00782.1 hypothetical protein K6K41_03655 [Chenggangzhangella methanolivorans]
MTADRPVKQALHGAAARSVAQNGISPDTVAEARRLYESSALSIEAIATRVGVGRTSVRRLAEKGGWRRPAAAQARKRLVGAIREKAEKEIVAAEAALAGGGDAGPAARTLASLVRTLRELARYDEEQARSDGQGRAGGRAAGADMVDGEEFDGFVADPDAFRDALAQRLEKLRDERGT